MFSCSGSSYQTTGYYPGGGGPTIVQDQVPRTQYDVDIYKIKTQHELQTMQLRYNLERQNKQDIWVQNKDSIKEKLDAIDRLVSDVKELMYI